MGIGADDVRHGHLIISPDLATGRVELVVESPGRRHVATLTPEELEAVTEVLVSVDSGPERSELSARLRKTIGRDPFESAGDGSPLKLGGLPWWAELLMALGAVISLTDDPGAPRTFLGVALAALTLYSLVRRGLRSWSRR
ncbi:hypothetical protein KBX06_06265 [Micromonospora sp. C31]|uniref:hypothetical protein n=1 Tax=Micromonospora sp. C31 TaxID=2824876 RepID=UPI001B35F39B|nr:hypothetical protein [Micromonospora sp. C31]MBQ1072769.1 hypothetical protein [Micromonospora sp. C31]